LIDRFQSLNRVASRGDATKSGKQGPSSRLEHRAAYDQYNPSAVKYDTATRQSHQPSFMQSDLCCFGQQSSNRWPRNAALFVSGSPKGIQLQPSCTSCKHLHSYLATHSPTTLDFNLPTPPPSDLISSLIKGPLSSISTLLDHINPFCSHGTTI
jgi:hypothetical protein